MKKKELKPPATFGHYHVEYASGLTYNGPLLHIAEVIRRKADHKIKEASFVCSYGCGVPHKLIEADLAALGLNADFSLRSGPDRLLELCDRAMELVDDCSELGTTPTSEVRDAIKRIKDGIRKLHAKKPEPVKKGKRYGDVG